MSVDRQDVKQWAREDAPIVQVEGIEQGREDDSSSISSSKTRTHSSEGEAHFHKGDSIRSSNDLEEGVPPSFFQKLKGSFLGAEDKLMSKDAQHAKAADPHPSLTPEAPGMFSHLHESLWGHKRQAGASPKDVPEEVKNRAKGSAVQAEEKGAFGSNELGTGYEEDTETGALSSDCSLDSSDKEGFSSKPESLFKPVKENNASELSLEDLRAAKGNKGVGSPDDIKAPGVIGRAMEEVEAVSDQVMEGLHLKEKR